MISMAYLENTMIMKLTFYKYLQEKLRDSARREGDICVKDLIKEKEPKLFWNKE
jgi:hypothetical protein